jgi:hypothetical protein
MQKNSTEIHYCQNIKVSSILMRITLRKYRNRIEMFDLDRKLKFFDIRTRKVIAVLCMTNKRFKHIKPDKAKKMLNRIGFETPVQTKVFGNHEQLTI